MKVGSMFAGIGGFDLGFERAGFNVAWCIEWDKNAQAVLRKRFPNATIYGDIREVDADKLERVDVVCGGFPCQDLSVAGKRAGLAGERSGLFHDAMRLVRRLRPTILILENVAGLHSSNRGLDFATVLREVGEGWDCQEVAWRVLDSQYFGVAQRRRRVFIVGSARAGCAEQILALAEGGSGDPPSRDKARKDAPSDAARCFAGSRESTIAAPLETTAHDYSRADGFNIVVGTIDCDIPKQRAQNSDDHETWVDDGTANTLNGFDTGDTRTTHAVTVAVGMDSEFNGRIEQMGTLRRGGQGGTENCVAFHPTQDPISSAERTHAVAHAFSSTGGSHGLNSEPNICPTLTVGSALGIPSPPAVCTSTIVRRLTPVECERLQGFPDGWTDIGTPDKPTADTHRYKQLGNAVTVNVAEWIARRTAEALA